MSSLIRPNPVRAILRAGGTAYGTMAFEFFSPGLMTILAEAGADFVLLDTEHSGVGIETIKTQIAASRGLGIVPMVRVPGCHYPAEWVVSARLARCGALRRSSPF